MLVAEQVSFGIEVGEYSTSGMKSNNHIAGIYWLNNHRKLFLVCDRKAIDIKLADISVSVTGSTGNGVMQRYIFPNNTGRWFLNDRKNTGFAKSSD